MNPWLRRVLGAVAVGAVGGAIIVPAVTPGGGEVELQTEDCFAVPSLCGFPDPTNTGVEEGASLTSASSQIVSTEGATLEGKEITGSVEVEADNVTLKNLKITQTGNCGTVETCGNSAIEVDEGVSGTTIEHVETATTSGKTCEHDIRNHGTGTLVTDSYLHACDSNVWNSGTLTLEDSYGLAKIDIETDHVENVYCADTTFTAIHDTLLNPVEQTAVVFCDVNGGAGGTCANHITVEESLLAGGGYTLYPCGNGTSKGTATLSVKNNHFARCLTEEIDGGFGHWVCKGGADEHGYYPNSGSFNLMAFNFVTGGWTGNVWDDNGEEIAEP